MIIFLIALMVLTFYDFKIENNINYLDKSQTTSINGIFIIIVFLSHSRSYIELTGMWTGVYNLFFALIGQMMVVMFLFYSGFGLYEQYSKNEEYLHHFMYKRVFKTWIHFMVAIGVFLLLNVIFSREYSIKDILLSFVGWTSIGNSNWYIFDILVLYILFYLSGILGKTISDSPRIFLQTLWLLVIIFWVFLSICKERYWFDTILAFPLGATFSYFKDTIEDILIKKNRWNMTFAISVVLFCVFYTIRNNIGLSISALFFAMIIVLVTMKVIIGNEFLLFLGKNLFPIYIFQRVPMIVLKELGVKNPLIFVSLSALLTIVIACAATRFYGELDKKLFALI